MPRTQSGVISDDSPGRSLMRRLSDHQMVNYSCFAVQADSLLQINHLLHSVLLATIAFIMGQGHISHMIALPQDIHTFPKM